MDDREHAEVLRANVEAHGLDAIMGARRLVAALRRAIELLDPPTPEVVCRCRGAFPHQRRPSCEPMPIDMSAPDWSKVARLLRLHAGNPMEPLLTSECLQAAKLCEAMPAIEAMLVVCDKQKWFHPSIGLSEVSDAADRVLEALK